MPSGGHVFHRYRFWGDSHVILRGEFIDQSGSCSMFGSVVIVGYGFMDHRLRRRSICWLLGLFEVGDVVFRGIAAYRLGATRFSGTGPGDLREISCRLV